jgi:hypothetical protein
MWGKKARTTDYFLPDEDLKKELNPSLGEKQRPCLCFSP